jgi:hypothetical protein
MPRYLLSLFVALAAPLLMAMSCTLPAATIYGTGEVCTALNWQVNCVNTLFYKSSRDGKWYACRDLYSSIMQAGSCMSDPANRVSDERNAILDRLAGNTAGSSTPPVTDPVFTDTPSSTPPPTTPVEPD